MREWRVKIDPVAGIAGRHEALVPAACEVCFAVLRDVGTYPRWWTLAQADVRTGESRLGPGAEFRVQATLPGGVGLGWAGRVVAAQAPRRLELDYDAGDLLGNATWELVPGPDGTLVTHVATAVRAAGPVTSPLAAYRALVAGDALPGLVRLFGGAGAALDDGAWRVTVVQRVGALFAQHPGAGG